MQLLIMNIISIIKKYHSRLTNGNDTLKWWITNQFSQDFLYLQNGKEASPDLAHLHNLHVVFLQVLVCVTLSIVKVSSTVCHGGTHSSSFPCCQLHSITFGICTFGMHSLHNQPPWIHACLIYSVNPGCERGNYLMLTETFHLKWAAL